MGSPPASMQRTWVGLGFGGACGLTVGVGVVIVFGGSGGIESEQAALVGTLMAGAGAAAGAVVGGVADILKFLRETLGKPDALPGHEADYRDPLPPAP